MKYYTVILEISTHRILLLPRIKEATRSKTRFQNQEEEKAEEIYTFHPHSEWDSACQG